MDDKEIRKFRPVFVSANLENKKKLVQGLTEDRVKLIKELKKYRNALSPFLINVLQTNLDEWEIEIHDWQEEIKKKKKRKRAFKCSQFVDKRGSEFINSEPLLRFPLNFRPRLRDWGCASHSFRPLLDIAMSKWLSPSNYR
ncbi:hypothetical protein [Peribacillus sp. ACCC06369]|uniref:hypothetical protein n=1 Tax=Peribacillus sp. ACCC06369 TaxID=3055860 RepID=UPI0025A26696|nr:hypothetical protein [Peribacillus sp. ACCC06369]MDM5357143.1 hypothetical protein [Peribacillus sp. ACCC06369]